MGLNAPVELHIEELVFEGLSPAEARRAGAALQAELARLFSERGLPAGFRGCSAVETLDGGVIDLRPGLRPEAVGQLVAQRLYERFSK